MKKIILYFMLGTLIFASCDKKCKELTRPKDLKPIDWENYNDVYTVSYNSVFYCYRASLIPEKFREEPLVKIVGKINCNNFENGRLTFMLYDINNGSNIEIILTPILFDSASNKAIFDTIAYRKVVMQLNDPENLKKRCYITGTLLLDCLYQSSCSVTRGGIRLNDANNIYFK